MFLTLIKKGHARGAGQWSVLDISAACPRSECQSCFPEWLWKLCPRCQHFCGCLFFQFSSWLLPTALHCQTLTMSCAWWVGGGGYINGVSLLTPLRNLRMSGCTLQECFRACFLFPNKKNSARAKWVDLYLKEITAYNLSFVCCREKHSSLWCVYVCVECL